MVLDKLASRSQRILVPWQEQPRSLSPLLYKLYFIVSNVVVYLYIYCLYAINAHRCIKFDNLQVKVSG